MCIRDRSKYTHPKDEESYMYYYEVEDPEADTAEKKKQRKILLTLMIFYLLDFYSLREDLFKEKKVIPYNREIGF